MAVPGTSRPATAKQARNRLLRNACQDQAYFVSRDRVIHPSSPSIMHLAPGVTNDPVQMPDLPGGIAQLTLQQLQQLRQKS